MPLCDSLRMRKTLPGASESISPWSDQAQCPPSPVMAKATTYCHAQPGPSMCPLRRAELSSPLGHVQKGQIPEQNQEVILVTEF